MSLREAFIRLCLSERGFLRFRSKCVFFFCFFLREHLGKINDGITVGVTRCPAPVLCKVSPRSCPVEHLGTMHFAAFRGGPGLQRAPGMQFCPGLPGTRSAAFIHLFIRRGFLWRLSHQNNEQKVAALRQPALPALYPPLPLPLPRPSPPQWSSLRIPALFLARCFMN